VIADIRLSPPLGNINPLMEIVVRKIAAFAATLNKCGDRHLIKI
jgi:hypothetical protein